MSLRLLPGLAAAWWLGVMAVPALRAEEPRTLMVRAEPHTRMRSQTVALRYELLKQALQASGRKFELANCRLPDDSVSDARHALLVKDNKDCNVLSTSGGAPFTRDLLLVPVPMYLGAGGYRVFLVHARAQPRLAAVRTLADLQQLTLGSGTFWIDTEIMRAAQLQVVAAEYNQLFPMLQRGRFDALSRSILEIHNEKAMASGLDGLQVDPYLLLHYPSDLFFYVSPREPEIQQALTEGMERLYASGKLMQWLRRMGGSKVEMQALRLPQRTRIDIPNPYLRPDEAAALKKYASAWMQ